MIDQNSKRVLLGEIHTWHREGLITDDQRDLLTQRYARLADTPEEVARGEERKTSAMMVVLTAFGGGLIVLGTGYLVGNFWSDLGVIGQHLICWGLCVLAYGVAHKLFATRRYPRTTVAVTAIGNVLFAWAAGMTLDYLKPMQSEDDWYVYFGLLTIVYAVMSLRTQSEFLGLFAAVALIGVDLNIGFGLLDISERYGVIYCTATGLVMALVAYLLSSTPARCLTVGLGAAGLGTALVSSFVGTFYDEELNDLLGVYVFSYILMFVIPIATAAFGALRNLPALVYMGVVCLWVSLLWLFEDIFEDVTPVFVAAIFLGIVTIWGAIVYERRRGAGGARPAAAAAAALQPPESH